ncbi:tetratricopeptide repeat protein [Helicobacter kayseriensis]|uniref:tetratricopeptide repeat protein n=1 Tax=Helicobacter kayseriensis TaxID=2905877 RepID=UPI001E641D58|nr:hypothetical protein [Helicobacter kayseriensis]MCE3047411.1 hypothetical protein [Helicobacter kayseriensis]MCE3048918.1 hypothetical protein [Helicobacter kayseriensis]
MRFFLLFLLFNAVYGLEIQVNFGKEKGEDFSVLNLKHKTAFECKENKDVYNNITSITCTIPQTPINNFVPTNTAFFNLSNSITHNNLTLTITPKYKAKLFSTLLDLKTQRRIPKERPKKSKQWQIIGYKSEIPFLSQQQTQGLNFPIQIPSNNNLYIGQLDINLNPLHYEEGVDFKQLRNIKAIYDQKDYKQALQDASFALKAYPESIFKHDFLFFKIKSLSHLLSKDNFDSFTSSATKWLNESSLDKNTPEVLYLLANAYINHNFENEAYYYYKRILNEYPQTEWSALAKMQLAKNFSNNSRFKISPSLFSEAYAEANSQSTRDEILVTWGISMLEKDPKEASTLIQTVLTKTPSYFSDNPQRTLGILKELSSKKAFDLAFKIGQLLLGNSPKNSPYLEQLLFELGDYAQKADDTRQAHRYNEQFLTQFPKSKLSKIVASRDDQLLFKMGENLTDEEKLAIFDQIIEKYPNTQTAQNAYLKKAQLLFDLKRYKQVIALESFIPQSPLIPKSKTNLIINLVQNQQCKQVPQYLKGSDLQTFEEKDRLSVFDCLYSLSYYRDAKKLIEDTDQKEANEKLPWLYRTSKVLNKLGDFAMSRKSGEDTLNLAQASNQTQYYDIGFVIFDDLIKLNLIPQGQKISVFLEEHFPQDSKILEVWYALLKNAQNLGDENALQIYATKILKLQQEIRFFDYTPNVNFILIYSLMKTKQYAKADSYLAELLEAKIQPQEMQQALYIQGALLKAMGKDPKESFEKCLQIQEKTNWQNLCRESLQN